MGSIPEGVNPTLSCQCSAVIMKSHEGGTEKVRAKVILVKPNGIYAVCKSCDTAVKLPFVRTDVPPEDRPMTGPPLILRR